MTDIRPYVTNPDRAHFIQAKVTPIMPFLEAKCAHGDKGLIGPLSAILDEELLPNTPDWMEYFGTNPIKVTDKPVNGRYLFNKDEFKNLVKASKKDKKDDS